MSSPVGTGRSPRIANLFPNINQAVKNPLNPVTLQMIFVDPSTQQDVRPDARELCEQLKIDPDVLRLREQRDFDKQESNSSKNMQDIRYKHYQSKRLKHLEEIEQLIMYENSPRLGSARGDIVKVPDTLRAGYHASYNKKNTMSMVTPKMSKKLTNKLPSVVDMGISKRQSLALSQQKSSIAIDPRRRNNDIGHKSQLHEKSRMTDRLSMDMPSNERIQVALRVPLDGEYEGNRKLARVIFESEMVEKVANHQVQKSIDLEDTKQAIISKQRKDEKRYAKEILERDKAFKTRNLEAQGKINLVQTTKKMINSQREDELRERLHTIKEKDEKHRQDKVKKHLAHEEELFQQDLQRAYDKEYNKGEAELKQKRALKEMNDKIANYQKVSTEKADYVQRQIEDRKNALQQVAKVWESKRQTILDEDYILSPDEIKALKIKKDKLNISNEKVIIQKPAEYLSAFSVDRQKIEFFKQGTQLKDRLEKSEKKRTKSMQVRQKILSEKMVEKELLKKNNLVQQRQGEKIKIEEIEEKDAKKQEHIKQIKDAWKKDIETVKELRNLRRQDQQENYQRGQMMHQLYKQKLIQKIVSQNMIANMKKKK